VRAFSIPGYNVTAMAKTYTLGTSCTAESETSITQAAQHIFYNMKEIENTKFSAIGRGCAVKTG
jgi:hypothetical protein